MTRLGILEAGRCRGRARPTRRAGGGAWFTLRGAFLWAVLAFACAACGGGAGGLYSQSPPVHDFPPLEDPNRPSVPETQPPAQAPSRPDDPGTGPSRETAPPEEELMQTMPGRGAYNAYRLGVGDELTIVVLGEPSFTRPVKVLPDGSFNSPGAGQVFALGRTVSDVSSDLETRLERYLRYPEVDVVVSAYGEHVIYSMGEVELPGDHPYRKGMTALEAVAQAGGFSERARRNSVVVLRRAGPNTTEFYEIDLKDPLSGEGLDKDMVLQPYDVVYVPRTFIGDVNVFIDQWFRQTVAPFNFYLQGWAAYNTTQDQVIIRTLP